MKAKINKFAGCYQWYIYFSNGERACQSGFYTRRDNAKRGLKRFVNRMITTGTYLDEEFLG